EDEDVDLRVAEEPEEVLPEERLTTAGGVEEMRPRHAVEEEHAERGREHGEGQEEQDGGDEERPDGEREAEPGHAGGPQVDDRRDVVDRPHERGDAEDDQADAPEVLSPIDAGVDGIG